MNKVIIIIKEEIMLMILHIIKKRMNQVIRLKCSDLMDLNSLDIITIMEIITNRQIIVDSQKIHFKIIIMIINKC